MISVFRNTQPQDSKSIQLTNLFVFQKEDDPAKKEDKPDDLNKESKTCKQTWYRFGMMQGGKITFSQNEKDTNTKSDVKMCSSKITPLPQDNI